MGFSGWMIESFRLRKFSSAEELLSPVRISARFHDRLYSQRGGRPYIEQPPSLAMSTVTDQRLQKMGLYAPLIGKEHARDAAKHAVTWLKRAKKLFENNLVVGAFVGRDGKK